VSTSTAKNTRLLILLVQINRLPGDAYVMPQSSILVSRKCRTDCIIHHICLDKCAFHSPFMACVRSLKVRACFIYPPIGMLTTATDVDVVVASTFKKQSGALDLLVLLEPCAALRSACDHLGLPCDRISQDIPVHIKPDVLQHLQRMSPVPRRLLGPGRCRFLNSSWSYRVSTVHS
jgi:hypothetical protein